MKLSELNGTHIGKTVRIQTNGGAIEGVLFKVSHHADKIEDATMFSLDVRFSPGRARTDVEVGAATANDLDPLFDVEILEGA